MNYILPLFILIFTSTPCHAADSDQKRQALFHGLDPTSIRQHLSFYELYKESPEGKKALNHAWKLLAGSNSHDTATALTLPHTVQSFIDLISPLTNTEEAAVLDDETSSAIDILAKNLANRSKKGCSVESEQELLTLENHEIDLARAVLLTQLPEKDLRKIVRFERSLDLMALQVLAQAGPEKKPLDIIRALNDLIFFQMQFRFPPHSSYTDKIDLFTFLPNILESRRGVCLGVSTLYLCLAQRLGLDLEIVTPPGHIFVRYQDQSETKNIETTCRGIHLPTEEYLSINTKKLAVRSIREVIGMAHHNQASTFLAKENFEQASICYKKALQFISDDPQLLTLYGCSLLLADRKAEALDILKVAAKKQDSNIVTEPNLAIDIINQHIDKEGLKPYFFYVDETQSSVVRKQKALEEACKRFPHFRAGLFQLAMCALQLGQETKAIQVLEQIHAVDPNDIVVEYYLAELYLSRFDAPSSWKHCRKAVELAKESSYMPKILEHFMLELSKVSPDTE